MLHQAAAEAAAASGMMMRESPPQKKKHAWEAILIAAHEPAAFFDALFLLSYVGDLV